MPDIIQSDDINELAHLRRAYHSPYAFQATNCEFCLIKTGPSEKEGGPPVVIDDGHNPCPETTRQQCLSLGAGRVSKWPRGCNLNGHECIVGILSEMNSGTESDISLKLDCDTLVANTDWLRDWRGAGDGEGVFGCCYALRVGAIKPLLASFRDSPAGQHAPEDKTISRRLLEIGGLIDRLPMKLPWPDQYGNGPDGIFIAWNSNYPAPALYIPRYSVINCGNPGVNKLKAMESLKAAVDDGVTEGTEKCN